MSEHQPTTWFSFFFDLHILVCVFPVGLWLCIKNINDERVFIILYAVSAVYFAGVMVRLMLTLTPCVCILAAIGKISDKLFVTGKSLSEALIFASTNPHYDDRLFIELQVQYMKIASSEHGENMSRTCYVHKLF